MPRRSNVHSLVKCKCKSTGGYYDVLVLAIFRPGAGVQSIPVDFMFFLYKLTSENFICDGTIVVYGSVTPWVIKFMVWLGNLTQFWSLTMTGAFF